ncbi:MAG: peptidase, partial [Bacteroidetes bacterium]|nr:peptidase [Bacteroidota bacterium]
MFKKIVPITKEAHGNKKIKKIDTMKFTENIHISSIMMHEFARASAIYPIVFLEDNNIQEFKP